MITCLHGGRGLDGVDREDHPRAFPRERHVESFLGIEDDDVLIEVRIGAGDHPAIYVSSILPEPIFDPEPAAATLKVAA